MSSYDFIEASRRFGIPVTDDINLEGARYLMARGGYMVLGKSQVAAFVKSRPEVDCADIQICFRPMTFIFHADGHVKVDKDPGRRGIGIHSAPKNDGQGYPALEQCC